MDEAQAKEKLAAVAVELGREIRVFTNPASSRTSDEVSASNDEEPDDFYEFTPEDYVRTMADRLGAQSQVLKTRKIREAEAAARRARITKAVIRVRFPDNYMLEAKFQPSETIQDLMDLLKKVVAQPELPFYLYTTPPKERIKDMSKDFYSAGFAPGAYIYYSYDLPKVADSDSIAAKPYLRDDILSLDGLDLRHKQGNPVNSEQESTRVEDIPATSEPKPVAKKPNKPKWLKL